MKLNDEKRSIKKEEKRFLKLYKEKYIELVQDIEKSLKKNQTVSTKKPAIDGMYDRREFVKKLMLQLVFLYFVQNKENGNNAYIRENFQSYRKSDKNFFKEFLCPLFYQTPNVFFKRPLFKPSKLEMERQTDLVIPNEIFSKQDLQEKNSDGLLDLLDKFHFTLEEKKPNKDTTSIGPEILEEIFESLLGQEEKKTKGVYYTSDEIVSYMCQESLAYYLEQVGPLSYKENAEFIKHGKLNKKNTKRKILAIDQALENIKLADLAVGSGAYPLGMLAEIARARNNLTKYMGEQKLAKQSSLYDFKLNAIKNSIFAMDIDEKAIEITRWRLYLSLLTEGKIEEGVDMNIFLGNALIENFKGKKTGFDLLIGNPPYIGEKGNKNVFRKIAKTDWGGKYYQGKMDLFYFFFHRAIDLCKEGGIINFITTNYFTTADGALKLRLDIKKRTQVLKLINFNEVKLFQSAIGQHSLISILKKGDTSKEQTTQVMTVKAKGEVQCHTCKADEIFEGEKAYIRIRGRGEGPIKDILDKTSKGILLGEVCYVNQGIISGADILTDRHISRFEIKGERGQGIFVLKEEEIKKKDFSCQELKLLKPFYKNSDIERYHASHKSDKRIIYIDRTIKSIEAIYPTIAKHLQKYQSILSQRREVARGYIEPFHLHWSRKQNIFQDEKIIAPQRSLRNTFAYNAAPWYASADVYYITAKDKTINLKYILGILNSKLYYLWFYYKGKRKGEILELYQTPLKETPILFCQERSQEIVDFVEQMMTEKETKKKEIIQHKLDQIVYKIYCLSPKEIQYMNQLTVRG